MASANADIEHVWDLAEKISTAMLTNWDGHRLHSRPMSAQLKRGENTVYFLADKRTHKADDIKRFPEVCLVFSDANGQKFVSVTGHASVSDDRAIIDRLWSTWAKAWWPSADDPNICVLKVEPSEAEYWDTPGRIVSTVKMAVAATTGEKPDIGEHRKVAM